MSSSPSSNKRMVRLFQKIALLEGISFLLLVCIGMPLKYWAGFPHVVKYVGWMHGVLFISYLFALIQCSITYSWKFSRVSSFFFASLIPLAPFFVEKKLKQETDRS